MPDYTLYPNYHGHAAYDADCRIVFAHQILPAKTVAERKHLATPLTSLGGVGDVLVAFQVPSGARGIRADACWRCPRSS